MFPKMTEEEVKDKYPEASLHEIDTNRICLLPGHFEKIFKSYMNVSPLRYRKQRNVYVSMIPVVNHLS